MGLDQHSKVVGCDFDSDGLSAAEPDFLVTVALQALSSNSNSTAGI